MIPKSSHPDPDAPPAKMYVIQWADPWGRTKERTVWAENGLAALRQVQKSTARIISPKANI